ncbi:hypothetical protein [Aliarcobacter cryaerophilus]|uniref:hypothetical protein n=1 Tax=Aliarcobacter cryaerophilus TaxID=28198 RepID=UPI0011DF852A|nr:hypothetical protein [Aliarcobacter cryaerophilus]
MRNIIFILLTLIVFTGCPYGEPTYETFLKNMELNKRIWTPNEYMINNFREIYSEDRYIYRFERPKGCHFAFLTNRDDKPEKMMEWIIISGKEYCKHQKRM